MSHLRRRLVGLLTILAVLLSGTAAAGADPDQPMVVGRSGWTAEPLFTVGTEISGYTPPGNLDGVTAMTGTEGGRRVVRVYVNHEIGAEAGYAYRLANGLLLTGARVSELTFDAADASIIGAELGYAAIYDRRGNEVLDAGQINEKGHPEAGLSRLCSSQLYPAGDYGFVDDLLITGEEASQPTHPHGGSIWVMDVATGQLWAAPELGRGRWENVAAVDTGEPTTVGLLLGDDTSGAPLYLYVGRKDALGDGSFLDRNGLAVGQMFVFKAWWKNGKRPQKPGDFHGTGRQQGGRFVPIDVRDETKAGLSGYDRDGYLDADTLRNAARGQQAFAFARPEDLDTKPSNGRMAVFAATGDSSRYQADTWGTVYKLWIQDRGYGPNDVQIRARLTIIHDGDDFEDYGIRSPDNLEWSPDGDVYVQENKATKPGSLFGADSGREASIAALHPWWRDFSIIAEVDRSVVLPVGSTDSRSGVIGAWETSGVLDVTALFDGEPGSTRLLVTVQAHSITDGSIASAGLVEGGQLVLLSE